MPDIEVPGIGILNFPEGMSDADIERAIKNHPNYAELATPKDTKEEQYKKSYKAATNNWQKFDAVVNLGLLKAKNKVSGAMESIGLPGGVPGHETMSKLVTPSLTKGIPIAKQYVPQTPELSDFEEKHPKLATGLNLIGAVGSTLPLAGAAAMRAGGGFLNQLIGQTAVSAPLNAADLIAKKGTDATAGEGAKALGTGVATSILPAAVTGTIGQAGRTSYPWSHLKDYVESLKGYRGNFFGTGSKAVPSAPPPWVNPGSGGTVLGVPQGGGSLAPMPSANIPRYPAGAPTMPNPDWATKAGTQIPGSQIPGATQGLTTALGGAAGAYGAADPVAGLLLGSLAGSTAIPHILRVLGHTPVGHALDTAAHHPSTQDILRTLLAQVGQQPSPRQYAP